MEISPPSNMQQQGGVKIGSDGKFQMENVSEEMRCASQPSHGSLSLNPSLPPVPLLSLSLSELLSSFHPTFHFL